MTYAVGSIIEYTSFDQSGYSTGQVIKYAPDNEQTRTCPNCDQLAVPAEGDRRVNGLRRCTRCQAFVRFPDLDPLVYIRTRSGEKPFPVRESQIRLRRIAEQRAAESDFDPEALPAPELIRYAERLIRWDHHVLDDDWAFWGNLAGHLNEMATIPERTGKDWPGKYRGFNRAQEMAAGYIRMCAAAARKAGDELT